MSLSKSIEHTILKPDCTQDDIKRLCQETQQHDFYGVCVPPYFVKDAARFLNESAKVVTVVGFPMGYSTIPAKVEEIKKASSGEIDTEHSTNPVPLWYITPDNHREKNAEQMVREQNEVNGLLSDVAVTILDIMEIQKPAEMNGTSLLSVLK